MTVLADAVVSLSGIWSWFSDPRAVWDAANEKLYFGDLRFDGVVAIYSLDDVGTYDFYLHGTPRTAVLEVDDHDNPALCLLANGELLVGYSQHVGDSYTARANGAGQIAAWNSEVAVASGGTNYTYVDFVQLGDSNNTVLYFFRDDADSHRKFRKSTNNGLTWGSAVDWLENTSTNRPYVKYVKNGSLRVDFLTTNSGPNEGPANASLYAGYILFSADGTTQTYHQLDGTEVTTPPVLATEFTLVYDGSTNEAWCWDIKIIGGNPVYGWVHFEGSYTDHFYHQSRWNGSAIVSEQIVQSGDGTADYLYAGSATYSGGIALDPNNIDVVYLSKRYSATDFRIEQWTHTGTFGSGSWAKTADTSGNTSTINARPFTVDCSGVTRVLWWEGSYTNYTSYMTQIRMSPAPTWKKAKPASPSWTATYAPAGVQAYYLLNEGSGAPADLTGNGYGGSLVGTPTWNAGAGDDFGAFLSGFDTSNYVTLNTLAAALSPDSFPFWMALLFKTVSVGTTTEWSFTFGRSSSDTPILSLFHNSGSGDNFGTFDRNDAGTTATPVSTGDGANDGKQNDGEFHALMMFRTAAAAHAVRLDGVNGATAVDNATTPITLDRGALGVLLRGSAAGAYSGEIHAAMVGWGAAPDRMWLAMDLIRGQFAGTYNPVAGDVLFAQSCF